MRNLIASLSALSRGTVAVGLLVLATASCGDENDKYKPTPAYSGAKAGLPPVPQLPTDPIRVGDSYTVFGAIHQLRSRYHAADVTAKDISITGYIVDANIPRAPACAVHPTGKKDPDDCKSEIPSFWIADAKGNNTGQKIRVMGWASNFANVYDAMQKYKDQKDPPKPPPTPDQAGKPGFLVQDELWAVLIPYPLPAVGAKVKVTGRYGSIFGKSSAGIVSDPNNGLMTYGTVETLEPPTEPAAFPKK
jgi:hypothetical protein